MIVCVKRKGFFCCKKLNVELNSFFDVWWENAWHFPNYMLNIDDSRRSSAVDLIWTRSCFSSIIFLIRSSSLDILILERIISWRSKCFFDSYWFRLSTDDPFENVFSCRGFFIRETIDDFCASEMLRKWNFRMFEFALNEIQCHEYKSLNVFKSDTSELYPRVELRSLSIRS